mgnify:CR=1 FL=1
MPFELDRRLRATPQLDGSHVDGQDDAVLAQAGRRARAESRLGRSPRLMPMLPHYSGLDLEAGLAHRQSALDELLVAEVEDVENLGVGSFALHTATSRRVVGRTGARRRPRTGVVTDRDRNLVPQRGGTLRVAGE